MPRETYLLTPWSRVLLEKLTGFQLVKKFPAFYGTRRFITAFTNARQLSLSWASSIQSIPPHPTSWRYIILSSHLRLDLPSGLFPSGFPTKTLYTPLLSCIRATCPAHLVLLDLLTCAVKAPPKIIKREAGWAPTAGLGVLEKNNIPLPLPEFEPWIAQPVT